MTDTLENTLDLRPEGWIDIGPEYTVGAGSIARRWVDGYCPDGPYANVVRSLCIG
jgi:hypothetical protein